MPDGGARKPGIAEAPKPRYQAVKDFVLSRIATGEWAVNARIPSENELGPMLGVSRITVNRAFAELAREGRLRKVPGVGTFVAEGKPRTGLSSIESIVDEIRARGMEWACEVLSLGLVPLTDEAADAMGLPRGGRVPGSVILHKGDGLPIQLEERFIRPGYAPGYKEQDFSGRATYEYLREVGEVTEMEQTVTAILPGAPLARLLAVGPRDPCLVIRRRTFRRGDATTFSRLTQPASRFELSGRYRMQDGPGGHFSH
ncbi:UTRA domain-containing protein [Roseomonas xinghualingensis]|uniref:UTRA domain-containing protein n=1 Tax=Roseomonas xinghualingensis TaxID=2986475 RepID=UPI0021F1E282|nr:UTRA domain-containing protein [Roseomonas sp. SXEYE001]MCV4207076.1 UTRA domain-containing protein [Roseomonas sp. SXEYE001]